MPEPSTTVRLASCASAAPDFVLTQETAIEFANQHYSSVLRRRSIELLRQFLAHPAIATRHIAVDGIADLICLKNEDPDRRIARFTGAALDLAEKAARAALGRCGASTGEVAGIIVNTCTGYICPGLSTYLIERLGLTPSTEAYDLVGSGCGGALPNLRMGADIAARAGGRPVLCISVEICSATFQMADDISLLLSNAIFGDGAAAAVVWDRPQGLSVVGNAASFAPQYRDEVRFVHKNGALHNSLSLQLPGIMREVAPPFIRSLLAAHGLDAEHVQHWALHPGGEKILDGIVEEMGLAASAASVSREVLRDFGNMSSPTVLFALEKLMERGIAPGEYCCAVAYGAGLSLHGLLLRG
jgi:alkylresorcinol/alkylpyrone synthase